jgi:hypothetical protein
MHDVDVDGIQSNFCLYHDASCIRMLKSKAEYNGTGCRLCIAVRSALVCADALTCSMQLAVRVLSLDYIKLSTPPTRWSENKTTIAS